LKRLVDRLVEAARNDGRGSLLESEGMRLLEALGIGVPSHGVVDASGANSGEAIAAVKTPRVVVKVMAADVVHKSDIGGVRFCERHPDAVAATIRDMKERLPRVALRGFLLAEYVEGSAGPGGELLVGARWTNDFGPVVAFGPGGIHAEFLAANLRPGRRTAVVSAVSDPLRGLQDALEQAAVTSLVTQPQRGRAPALEAGRLVDVVERVRRFAAEFMPTPFRSFEVNPLVVRDGVCCALDVLVELSSSTVELAPARPVDKIKHLLEPQSVAVIGVSERMNPGRVIVNNLIREGFDRRRLYIIKENIDAIDGCTCYPDIASLPEPVDLLVLSIDAAQVPDTVTEVVRERKAESLIVIPGGMEEKSGTDGIVARMRETLAEARASRWRGPVINGANSLGVQSRPGHYDTLFIPRHKLGVQPLDNAPLAFISQSGAFAIAKNSKLRRIAPKYLISVGNQTDLTIGDYLDYLKDDDEIETFAVYAEGFKPGDGLKFVEAARKITAGGRHVLLYRGGRTAAGARASASHTAAIAGDYEVMRSLAMHAGVQVAESIADFEDLLALFCFLRSKATAGMRLGAVSNAGFETVAIADNLCGFDLADFSPGTVERIRGALSTARLEKIVDVHNPLDVTPIMGDGGFEEAFTAIMEDEGVDVALFGCVPLTPALNTLAPGDGHAEDLGQGGSIVSRLVELSRKSTKAFVAVVDGGAIYDPMAARLAENGIVVFRAVDRAMRLFARYTRARLNAPR